MPEGYIKEFQKATFNTIYSELRGYRLSPFIREQEAKKGKNKGLIFPFVRGLRFSALLIYAIRESLSGSELQVNWGQIVDSNGLACSGECDIIVHKKGHYKKWNGGDGGNHVMDFRFIEKENAIAVISCKSYLTNTTIEKEYCKNMLKYVKSIWLFAECCGPESVALIKKSSKEIGYENFWYLYTWSRTTDAEICDENGWYNFIETVKKLKEAPKKAAKKIPAKKVVKKVATKKAIAKNASLKVAPKKATKKAVPKKKIISAKR